MFVARWLARAAGWNGGLELSLRNHWVRRTRALAAELDAVAASDLRKRGLALKFRAQSGERLDDLLPEAFALARAAAGLTLGMRHHDVQLLGGVAMHAGYVAEMQTGEGKTLTASLPLCLAALAGRGAHLATANDYLARRDAELLRPLYQAIGLSVGVVEADTPRGRRRAAYQCDITYGTAKEIGFDFLRDRLAGHAASEDHTPWERPPRPGGDAETRGDAAGAEADGARPVQRGFHFALVDEADSLLIDEARTPLIISATPLASRRATRVLYVWAARVAERFFETLHYEHEPRLVTLTEQGRALARRLPRPAELAELPQLAIQTQIERAILVAREYTRDRQYIVRDGEVVIVDEFTGRLAEGRKWRAGLHQAVEAREGLEPSEETSEAARITVQNLFLRYQRLGGMTGTTANSQRELRRIFGLRVAVIPTHRPPRRRRWPDLVFGHAAAKWRAIVEETIQVRATGRSVLIGTRSIDKSEELSRLLTDAGVEHRVLNARQSAEEAKIVSQAGEPGRVTVATNMAGRGTDIKLRDETRAAGGMHVICSELHESRRIDRQLIGRCGRQGDPGSYRQFLALDDEILLAGFGPAWAERARRHGAERDGPLKGWSRSFARAQARVEGRHFAQRQALLRQEEQRRALLEQLGLDPYLDAPS